MKQLIYIALLTSAVLITSCRTSRQQVMLRSDEYTHVQTQADATQQEQVSVVAVQRSETVASATEEVEQWTVERIFSLPDSAGKQYMLSEKQVLTQVGRMQGSYRNGISRDTLNMQRASASSKVSSGESKVRHFAKEKHQTATHPPMLINWWIVTVAAIVLAVVVWQLWRARNGIRRAIGY